MSKFFIERPIVAMVISLITVIVGAVVIAGLPIAQFPAIAPPEVQVTATYVGADAQTSEAREGSPRCRGAAYFTGKALDEGGSADRGFGLQLGGGPS